MNRTLTCLALFALSASMTFAAQVRPPAVPPVTLPQSSPTPFARTRMPAATPTPAARSRTPRPTPTPAATQTPATTPVAIQTPAPTATPEIPLPPVNISLERVTMLRSRFYNPEQKDRPEIWKPRMILEFQVSIPKGWTLMSVDDGQLTSISDGRGQPIAPRRAVGAEGEVGKPGQAIALAVKPDHASLEFSTDLPGREDDRLGNITATFVMTLGLAQPVQITDLRSRKTATSLLPKDQFPDVIVALDQVGNDSISVAVLGDPSRITNISFKGPDGAKLEPFTQERTDSEPQAGKAPGTLYRYSFAKLPKQITMEVNYFSFKQRAVYTYKNNQIPLP